MKKAGYIYFNNEVAKEVGIKAAIIANHIDPCAEKNQNCKEKEYYDGHWWMSTSLGEFGKRFPYMSRNVIWKSIQTLKDKKFITSKNFAELHKRRLWYRPLPRYYLFLKSGEERRETIGEMMKVVAEANQIITEARRLIAETEQNIHGRGKE